MSKVIGYWSSSSGSQEKLNRQLIKALAEVGSTEFKVKPLCENQPILDSHNLKHLSPTNSCIAVCGRHATLQLATEKNERAATGASLTATLAASGVSFAPDAWVKASASDLVLGREMFGRATLFWKQTDDAVWFASHLKLLLNAIDCHHKISTSGFYAYACFSYVPAPLTPIENIFAVRAGSEVVWRTAEPLSTPPQTLIRHEWRESLTQITHERDAVGSLRRLLEESAEAQLERSSGNPIGVFLSGGLDSSVTAAMLVRAGAKVRAYTLDFGKDCFSETIYAERVAQRLKIPLTRIPVTPRRVRRLLATTARRLDSLYGDGVTVPLALLCERANQEVSVVFNGEGGDQLFAGWTNKPLITASVFEHVANFSDSPIPQSIQFAARGGISSGDALALNYMSTFHRLHNHETSVFTVATQRKIDNLDAVAWLADALDSTYTSTLLHRLRRANLMLKGADNIQPRATNLGLSYNLDVRTLFCLPALAEWTFRISGELWLRDGCEKYLLKRATEDYLPAETVWREKRGMGVPLTLWLTGKLRRWTRRNLHPRRLASEGLWQTDVAERIAIGELSGQVQGRRIGETLWLMLMWQAWGEQIQNYQLRIEN